MKKSEFSKKWTEIVSKRKGCKLKDDDELFVLNSISQSKTWETFVRNHSKISFEIGSRKFGHGKAVKGVIAVTERGSKIFIGKTKLISDLYPPKTKSPAREHRKLVLAAMRQAVGDQIKKFRYEIESQIVNGSRSPRCPLSGVDMRLTGRHVDHHNKPFADIVEEWLAFTQLDFSDIKISQRGTKIKFKDKNLSSSWEDFHLSHCDLVLVSAKANLKKGRNSAQNN